MATTNIRQSTAAYEHWLRAQLRGEIIEKDLRAKHERMAEGPFPFLRATYWRWSDIILDVCPDLAKAPSVLAVGDIHLENFGTWRDVEGRLVWGINDFDEAAEMPYAIDLVRRPLPRDRAGAPHLAPALQRPHRPAAGAVFESDVPIILQHTRMDSRRAEIALLSTMAYPEG